jgi:hypothetical protein
LIDEFILAVALWRREGWEREAENGEGEPAISDRKEETKERCPNAIAGPHVSTQAGHLCKWPTLPRRVKGEKVLGIRMIDQYAAHWFPSFLRTLFFPP